MMSSFIVRAFGWELPVSRRLVRQNFLTLGPEDDADPKHVDDLVQDNADDRKNDNDREGSCRVHREILLQKKIAEARLGSDEFTNDCADDGKDDGYIEASKDVGKRGLPL